LGIALQHLATPAVLVEGEESVTGVVLCVSRWEQLRKGAHSHGFCPGCGKEIRLAEAPIAPELLKCRDCGAEWVVIKGPGKEEKE